tara:strand:- start:437 stop:652 length:216 start_codon:yes stop_codon:yes gene_type:complete
MNGHPSSLLRFGEDRTRLTGRLDRIIPPPTKEHNKNIILPQLAVSIFIFGNTGQFALLPEVQMMEQTKAFN